MFSFGLTKAKSEQPQWELQNSSSSPLEEIEKAKGNSEMMESEMMEEETPEAIEEEMPEAIEEEPTTSQASPAGQKPGDIIETMPQGRFLHPQEGARLKGKVEIEFEVKGAKSLEFYLRRPESLTETYLGRANLKGEKVWHYSWLTKNSPNGAYILFPKITNEYGQYQGREISVKVENKIEKKAKEKEKQQALEKEIKEREREIQNREKEIEEKKEEIKEEVISQIEQISEKGKEMIAEKKKPIVEPEIEKKVKEFSEKTKENIERALEIKEKEKREAVGKEIAKEAQEIVKPILEAPKEGKKEEAKKLEEELTQRVARFLEKVEELSKEKQEVEKTKVSAFAKDSDKDGLPDREEIRLGTDPLNPDSDQDGFLDGSEVKLGFDPLKPSPADKIKYQEPEKTKVKISENLKIERVDLVVTKEKERALKIQGKALPYTFVTLYIYSLPIVVVAKADSQGNWEYILDKPLAEGQHKVYATVTNNRGEIEESSEPFVFAKSGENIVRIFGPSEASVASPAEVLQKSFAVLIVGLIFLALGIAFIIMSLLLRKKSKAH